MSYTLDQLLRWCQEDHLIDGFSKAGHSVTIIYDGSRRELPLGEAKRLIVGLIRQRASSQRTEDRGEVLSEKLGRRNRA